MQTDIRQEELLAQRGSAEEFQELEQESAAQEEEVLLCIFTHKLHLLCVDMYWIHLYSWPRFFPATSRSSAAKTLSHPLPPQSWTRACVAVLPPQPEQAADQVVEAR